MARETGLEPATSGVTGRRSNQLSYSPAGEREPIRQARAQVKDSAPLCGARENGKLARLARFPPAC
jgi:hypothetical protein